MPPKKASSAAAASSKTAAKRTTRKAAATTSKDSDAPKKRAKLAEKAVKKVAEEKKKPAPAEEEAEVPKRGRKAATAKKAGKSEQASDEAEDEDVSTNGKETTASGKPGTKRTRAKEKVIAETDENAVPKKKTKTAAGAKSGKKSSKKEEVNDDENLASGSTRAPAKRGQKPKVDKEKSSERDVKAKSTSTLQNTTVTNWETIDFGCPISGKSSNFHITSWNVDGLRAWAKKGGFNILKYDKPDILCLQEIKCSEDKLPDDIKDAEGYEKYWCSSDQEGYAGVGVLSKIKPLNIIYGINSEEHDDEGRCITAEYKDFYLVNVYVPNAGRKLVTLPKRLEWNTSFKLFVKELDKKKPVIVCGDMNVSHSEIDLANPKNNKKNAGFTDEEREGMTDFLEDGYVDTFRNLYPEKEKAYTFWTYMANARVKNVGWRLDYFILSSRWVDKICDSVILPQVFGSDHCPIALHLTV